MDQSDRDPELDAFDLDAPPVEKPCQHNRTYPWDRCNICGEPGPDKLWSSELRLHEEAEYRALGLGTFWDTPSSYTSSLREAESRILCLEHDLADARSALERLCNDARYVFDTGKLHDKELISSLKAACAYLKGSTEAPAPVIHQPAPPLGKCCRCGDRYNADGSPVEWRCSVCANLVCRVCTLTKPGTRPHEYYEQTFCSDVCWRLAGSPSD